MHIIHEALSHALLSIAEDAASYLKHIRAGDYTRCMPILSGATIGQHTRHYVEFFTCLYEQFNGEEGCVDYGSRKRDPLIESDPEAALKTLRKYIENINEQGERWGETVPARMDSDLPDATVPSSYGREILYAIEHCIHHLAIIKIGLNELDAKIELPDNFGVAPSTVKYREQTCAH